MRNGALGLAVVFLIGSTRAALAGPYEARVVAVSAPATLAPGQTSTVTIVYENTGSMAWDDRTRVGLSNARFAEPDRGGNSPFEAPGWLLHDRPASLGRVAPGAQGSVSFQIQAPRTTGDDAIFLELVQEAVTWFDGSGDDLALSITVAPGGETPSKVGRDGNGAAQTAVMNAYALLGGASVVGLPHDNGGGELVHPWGDAFIQDLRGGSGGTGALLFRSGETRAHWVHGGAWTAYLALGGCPGALGAPLGDASNGRQDFEHATLEDQGGAWVVVGPVRLGRVGIDGNQEVGNDGSLFLRDDIAARLGTKVVRLNVGRSAWSGPSDTTPHQGRTWFEAVDAVVDAYTKRGIGVYYLLDTSLVDGASVLRTTNDPNAARAWIEAFAAACEQVVGHLKDRVRVFEVVNEPNDWAGGSSAHVLPTWEALILERVYSRVKVAHAADPSWQVTLVSGPLFSFDLTTASDYLAQVYQEGIAAHGWSTVRSQCGSYPLDGIGYHLYCVQDASNTPAEVAPAFAQHLDDVSSVVAAWDPEAPSKKFWVSEFGWPSSSGGEQHQADMIAAGFDALLGDSRVALASAFCMVDFPGSSYGIDGKVAAARFRAIATR